MKRACLLFVVLLATVPAFSQTDHSYKYFLMGNATAAVNAKPRAGYALMGGGTDLDEAFRWLCNRVGGGDLLVLRATGDDDYNPYIKTLCPALNSVATMVIPNRAAAEDPFVAKTIRGASAVFIAGGDQANYINFWMKSPVQEALNADIAEGKPLGGTSAGLAVMGEWAYSAQGDKPDDPNLTGKLAMSDPFGPRITLVQDFLKIPQLAGIITDTHFAKRDRMGRLLIFLGRINEPDGKPEPPPGEPPVRGIGVEQGAAVLLEADGKATVIGHGDAYFVDAVRDALFTEIRGTLVFLNATVHKVTPGGHFDLRSWSGDATTYTLSIHKGTIRSTKVGGGVY